MRSGWPIDAINIVIDFIIATVPRKRMPCEECMWYRMIKPLVLPHVGAHRGWATDSVPLERHHVYTWQELFALRESRVRVEAESPIEEWLRTAQAYDLVTDHWLALVKAHSYNVHDERCDILHLLPRFHRPTFDVMNTK